MGRFNPFQVICHINTVGVLFVKDLSKLFLGCRLLLESTQLRFYELRKLKTYGSFGCTVNYISNGKSESSKKITANGSYLISSSFIS